LWLEIQIGLRTLEVDCLVSLLAMIIEVKKKKTKQNKTEQNKRIQTK